jgi:hypothetical protein
MAQANSNTPFTGTVNGLSYYKMRGSDKIIVRRKGGPTRKQIQKKESFATTRKNNMEFGGRARLVGQVMDALRPLKYLGDYNIAGPLNTMLIPIQSLDTEHEKGQRDVVLSKNPGILKGFNLNRRTPFENIVCSPLEFSLSKEKFTATITIPELNPEINFMIPGDFEWYRLMYVVATIDDMFYQPHGYRAENNNEVNSWRVEKTDWLPVYPGSPSVTLQHKKLEDYLDDPSELPNKARFSTMLAIGIAFGTMQRGQITMAKYIGGAKILEVI